MKANYRNKARCVIRFMVASLMLLFVVAVLPARAVEVINESYLPGQDKLTDYVGERVARDIALKILDDSGQPVVGAELFLVIVSKPKKATGEVLLDTRIVTGSDGVARTGFQLGSKPGLYVVTARTPVAPEKVVIVEIEARGRDWGVVLAIGLFGGLALFLYGMDVMGQGLIQLGGSRLSGIINALTRNRVMGVLVGTFVTAVIQSSSATTVIVVGLINAGVMNLAQSIGIILGANIGTTITAQIIAFKLTDYALVFITLGFLIIFFSRSKKKKHMGEILLGFGLLFYGIKIMGDAMYPIRSYEPFIAMMQSLENPLMGILVGTIFTALIQSSSASTGVFITLSFQGLLSLRAAIPLTFGANIGTCITAALAAVNANREARRAAIAHTLFNVLSSVIFLPFLAQYQALIEWMSGGVHATTPAEIIAHVPRQIANAHSVAKIIAVILFLPFTEHLARLATWCLPVRPETEGEKFKTKYISEDALTVPSAALSLAKQEILRMAYSTKSMLEISINLITKKDGKVAEIIRRSDDKVDRLNYEIRNYLTRIAQNLMEEEESKTQTSFMYIISNVEHIGDLLSKEMLALGEKYIHRDARLNEEDLQNIGKFHAMVDDLFARVLTAFKEDDKILLETILSESERRRIVSFENEIKRQHFAALARGCKQAEATTSVFLDLLNDYHAVFSHLLAIAHGLRGDF